MCYQSSTYTTTEWHLVELFKWVHSEWGYKSIFYTKTNPSLLATFQLTFQSKGNELPTCKDPWPLTIFLHRKTAKSSCQGLTLWHRELKLAFHCLLVIGWSDRFWRGAPAVIVWFHGKGSICAAACFLWTESICWNSMRDDKKVLYWVASTLSITLH